MKSSNIMVSILFVAILCPTAETLAQDDVECPSCSMTMYWTGKTKTGWGKMVKLYKCPAQHAYWIPWEAKKRKNYLDNGSTYQTPKFNPSCPVCGMDAYWTGKTRTEWGKLQKIYKCPVEHLSVGPF